MINRNSILIFFRFTNTPIKNKHVVFVNHKLTNKKMPQSCIITAKKKHFLSRYLVINTWLLEAKTATNIVFSSRWLSGL
jgi:hypothetical protein